MKDSIRNRALQLAKEYCEKERDFTSLEHFITVTKVVEYVLLNHKSHSGKDLLDER